MPHHPKGKNLISLIQVLENEEFNKCLEEINSWRYNLPSNLVLKRPEASISKEDTTKQLKCLVDVFNLIYLKLDSPQDSIEFQEKIVTILMEESLREIFVFLAKIKFEFFNDSDDSLYNKIIKMSQFINKLCGIYYDSFNEYLEKIYLVLCLKKASCNGLEGIKEKELKYLMSECGMLILYKHLFDKIKFSLTMEQVYQLSEIMLDIYLNYKYLYNEGRDMQSFVDPRMDERWVHFLTLYANKLNSEPSKTAELVAELEILRRTKGCIQVDDVADECFDLPPALNGAAYVILSIDWWLLKYGDADFEVNLYQALKWKQTKNHPWHYGPKILHTVTDHSKVIINLSNKETYTQISTKIPFTFFDSSTESRVKILVASLAGAGEKTEIKNYVEKFKNEEIFWHELFVDEFLRELYFAARGMNKDRLYIRLRKVGGSHCIVNLPLSKEALAFLKGLLPKNSARALKLIIKWSTKPHPNDDDFYRGQLLFYPQKEFTLYDSTINSPSACTCISNLLREQERQLFNVEEFFAGLSEYFKEYYAKFLNTLLTANGFGECAGMLNASTPSWDKIGNIPFTSNYAKHIDLINLRNKISKEYKMIITDAWILVEQNFLFTHILNGFYHKLDKYNINDLEKAAIERQFYSLLKTSTNNGNICLQSFRFLGGLLIYFNIAINKNEFDQGKKEKYKVKLNEILKSLLDDYPLLIHNMENFISISAGINPKLLEEHSINTYCTIRVNFEDSMVLMDYIFNLNNFHNIPADRLNSHSDMLFSSYSILIFSKSGFKKEVFFNITENAKHPVTVSFAYRWLTENFDNGTFLHTKDIRGEKLLALILNSLCQMECDEIKYFTIKFIAFFKRHPEKSSFKTESLAAILSEINDYVVEPNDFGAWNSKLESRKKYRAYLNEFKTVRHGYSNGSEEMDLKIIGNMELFKNQTWSCSVNEAGCIVVEAIDDLCEDHDTSRNSASPTGLLNGGNHEQEKTLIQYNPFDPTW